jgi:hypothetical protein
MGRIEGKHDRRNIWECSICFREFSINHPPHRVSCSRAGPIQSRANLKHYLHAFKSHMSILNKNHGYVPWGISNNIYFYCSCLQKLQKTLSISCREPARNIPQRTSAIINSKSLPGSRQINTMASVPSSNQMLTFLFPIKIASRALDEPESPSNNQGNNNKKDQNSKNAKEWGQVINFSPRNHDVHPKHTAHQIQWNED